MSVPMTLKLWVSLSLFVTVIVEPFLTMRQMGWKAKSLIAIVNDASLVKSVAVVPAGHDPDPVVGVLVDEAPCEPSLEDVPPEPPLDDPPSPLLHAAPKSTMSAIIAMTGFRTGTRPFFGVAEHRPTSRGAELAPSGARTQVEPGPSVRRPEYGVGASVMA
jgi:hypothetical protein